MKTLPPFDYSRIDLLSILIFALILVILLYAFGAFKKARELILPESEHAAYMDLVRQVYEKAINAVIVIDAEGKVLLWSPRAVYKFEWTAKEALGINITSLIIPEGFDKLHQMTFTEYVEAHKGNKFGVEIEAKSKSGRIIPIRLWLSEIGIDGVTKIAGFIADRTEEVKKLKDYEELVRHLESSEKISGTGYWHWDLIGKDVWVSKNFREVFNIEPDEPVSSDMLMELVYQEDREKTSLAIIEAMDLGQDYKVIYRRLERDGSLSEIVCKGVRIADEYNNTIMLHGTIQRRRDE